MGRSIDDVNDGGKESGTGDIGKDLRRDRMRDGLKERGETRHATPHLCVFERVCVCVCL